MNLVVDPVNEIYVVWDHHAAFVVYQGLHFTIHIRAFARISLAKRHLQKFSKPLVVPVGVVPGTARRKLNSQHCVGRWTHEPVHHVQRLLHPHRSPISVSGHFFELEIETDLPQVGLGVKGHIFNAYRNRSDIEFGGSITGLIEVPLCLVRVVLTLRQACTVVFAISRGYRVVVPYNTVPFKDGPDDALPILNVLKPFNKVSVLPRGSVFETADTSVIS